jgi:hypothetical protein
MQQALLRMLNSSPATWNSELAGKLTSNPITTYNTRLTTKIM